MAHGVKENVIIEELIFHFDRGSQYASFTFADIIKSYEELVIQSMSRKGNCSDNAVVESFFKSLKTEWVYKHNIIIGLKPNYQSLVGFKIGTIKEGSLYFRV